MLSLPSHSSMSTESPSKRIRTDGTVRSFERRSSDSSPTSTPLPTVVDSNHDNDTETRWVTWQSFDIHCNIHLYSFLILSSDLVLEMTPIVNVHHAPYISTPVLAPIPSVSSTSTAPECPSTVSSHFEFANCLTDYCPFRICYHRTSIALPSKALMYTWISRL